MLFQKKNNFCFLDIGSYKTSCLICNISKDKITPLSFSFVKTKGIKYGKIYDASELKTSILSSVYEAEQNTITNIDNVIISLPSVECFQKQVVVKDVLFGKQVLKEDIKKLINKSLTEIDSSKNEIIHFFPLRYCLDEVTVVKNPENLFADSIEAEVSLIYTSLAYLINLATILAECHLKPEDFILNSYASALAVDSNLNQVLIIDLGGDTTTFSYFEEKALVKMGYVKLGGNNITRDIANYFAINMEEAERLKTVYGDLLNRNDETLIAIKQFSTSIENEPNSIKRAMLNNIISARVEEIIEYIFTKTKLFRYKKIILTGGGAKLAGIASYFEDYFNKPTEIKSSIYSVGIKEIEDDPSFSSLIGLVNFFSKRDITQGKNTISKNPLYKILNWLKNNF